MKSKTVEKQMNSIIFDRFSIFVSKANACSDLATRNPQLTAYSSCAVLECSRPETPSTGKLIWGLGASGWKHSAHDCKVFDAQKTIMLTVSTHFL